MILADKIIDLRKRAGYSQEELAEQLGVSRQSISKWEGAQSMPDMNKILAMANLFGVSTDYLLRDEMEAPEGASVDSGTEEGLETVRVSMETARAYIEAKKAAAPKIAFGVLLCIFSPIMLILLGGLQEYGKIAVSENLAGGLGLIILMAMVVCAVCIFILAGSKLRKYEFIEKAPLDTEYGVAGLCREMIERQENSYTRSMVAGVGLCVASSIPLFAAMMMERDGTMRFLSLDLVIMDLIEAGSIALDQLTAQRTVILDIVAGKFRRLVQPASLSFGEDLIALRHGPEGRDQQEQQDFDDPHDEQRDAGDLRTADRKEAFLHDDDHGVLEPYGMQQQVQPLFRRFQGDVLFPEIGPREFPGVMYQHDIQDAGRIQRDQDHEETDPESFAR